MKKYEWKSNLACISTYKILEGDNKLDQFEEYEIPFDSAGKLKICDLRFFPKTTTNSDIIEVNSYEIARKFLKYLSKDYSVKKERKEVTSPEIISALATIFKSKEKTVLDLAETVDNLIKFSDE